MKRILLFKPGAIGDLLQITPVIRALSLEYPDSLITVMVGNRGASPLFLNNPLVHEVMVFDRKGEHSSLSSFYRLFKELKSRRFELVVNFQRSNIKGWLLLMAAARARFLVYHKATGKTVHAVKNHLDTLCPLGIKPDNADISLEFFPGEAASETAEEIFKSNQLSGSQVVALNPGASHPVNRWSTSQFAGLSDLIQADAFKRVLLVGGAGDRALADEIVSKVKIPVVNLAGTTDIETTGAVLSRCRLLVSGDTGPMHLATAVGTPVVALFGAADPERTGPVGSANIVLQASDVSCLPCRRRRCKSGEYMACMERLTVSSVLSGVNKMFEKIAANHKAS
jgi:heptosyltransferase II